MQIKKTGLIRVSLLLYLLKNIFYVTKLPALPRDFVTRLSCGTMTIFALHFLAPPIIFKSDTLYLLIIFYPSAVVQSDFLTTNIYNILMPFDDSLKWCPLLLRVYTLQGLT